MGMPNGWLGSWAAHANFPSYRNSLEADHGLPGGPSREQTPFGLSKLPSQSPSFVDGEAESGVIEVGAYRASLYDCRGCPLKSKCCPKASPRKVLRSLYEEARDAARAITASEAYAND